MSRSKAPNGSGAKFIRENVNYQSSDCLLWPFATKCYPDIRVDGKRIRAHRYMCILKRGPPPNQKMEAAHSCGNGHLGCVNPNHLRWLTPSENQRERAMHGTSNAGHRNGSRKLDEETVRRIRSETRSIKQISEAYKISRSNIWLIRTGKTWAEAQLP